MDNKVDIIIPVYNEGKNIISTLSSLFNNISYDFRVTICYDFEADDTLSAIKDSKFQKSKNIFFLKNFSKGPHSAVMTGILNSNSEYVIVLPADDDYNASIIDQMIDKALNEKYDIVV